MNSGKNKKKEPLIIIISSPSGGGKTTIVNTLLDKTEDIEQTISYTTRPPREGEQNKKDYIFVSEEEFKKKIENNEFLEWEQNFGHYYGTLEKQVEEMLDAGKDVILSIDVKGAKRIRKKHPDSVSVFIMPPSVDELKSRLAKRNTEGEDQLALRIRESTKEIEASEEYDYLIVNEKIEKAIEELKTIIEEERKNRKREKKEE